MRGKREREWKRRRETAATKSFQQTNIDFLSVLHCNCIGLGHLWVIGCKWESQSYPENGSSGYTSLSFSLKWPSVDHWWKQTKDREKERKKGRGGKKEEVEKKVQQVNVLAQHTEWWNWCTLLCLLWSTVGKHPPPAHLSIGTVQENKWSTRAATAGCQS